jgi:alpha-N-arabinofuranosidase
MKLAASLGAEVVITVNYGTGRDQTGAVSTSASLSQRVKRAAAWVAYLNGTPSDTRSLGVDDEGADWQTIGFWAQKRAQRGHPTPYGVRYWEIGNEVYGKWETGYTTVRRYAADFIEFAATMKTIDPTIEVGAVGRAEPHRRGDADSTDEWNATLVQLAGDYLDFLVLHPYYPSASLAQVQGSYTSTTWFTAVMAGAQQAIADLQEIRAIIAANSPRAGQIGLAVTEYGIWPADSNSASDFSSLARALHDADLLMSLIQQGALLDVILAAAWNLHGSNETAAIRYDWSTGSRVVRPQYYTLQLLNDFAPQLHSTTVNAPTFSTAQVGNLAAASSIPLLAAIAGSDGAGQLTLLVLNRSLSSALTTSVHLLGYIPQSTATVRTLTADSLAANNETNSSTVALTTADLSSVAATFNHTFPAGSLTLIEFQGSAQPVPPTALINPSSLRGPAPLAVTFDGSGSAAAAGADIISYQWDLDDGNKAAGMIASHTYTKPGTYTVTLSVTDSAGLSGTASVTIKVTSRTSKRR